MDDYFAASPFHRCLSLARMAWLWVAGPIVRLCLFRDVSFRCRSWCSASGFSPTASDATVRSARRSLVVGASGRGSVGAPRDSGGQPTSGIRTTYEPVEASVNVGQQVFAGEPLGTVVAGHEGGSLHWGARWAANEYVDPLTLLGMVPVLKQWD